MNMQNSLRCTLAGQWITGLSCWGDLRSHDRHCLTLLDGHFWQWLIFWLITLLFFSSSSKYGWWFYLYFGFSLIRFSRIARENCRKFFEWQRFSTFLSVKEYYSWASGGRIIFLAGIVASTGLIRLSIGKIWSGQLNTVIKKEVVWV